MNRAPVIRRRGLVAGALLLLAAGAGLAQEPAARPSTEIGSLQRVMTALDRALEYLAAQQRPDGAWADNNAVNALALLSFCGRGHVPQRGPYREVLERGKRALLATQRADGFFPSSMYMHALSTLALVEMYGMDADPQLETAVRKAVDLIVRCQSPAGGWRYAPQPGDQDLSVTIMQVVALRAANNAEIPVPAPTIEKALGFVRACSHPNGGFAYQPGGGPGPQMSAAGTLALQLLGQYHDERLAGALRYLETIPAEWGNAGGVSYFFYFHYYAMQAHYQAGGKHWNDWHRKVRDLFLARQNPDGSWSHPGGSSEANAVDKQNIYSTAMACLVLEIYNHFLPAYQR